MKFIGAVLGLLTTTASFTQAAVITVPNGAGDVKDTYVASGGDANTNFGSAINMAVYPINPSPFIFSLVQFTNLPTLGIGETVSSATLSLYIYELTDFGGGGSSVMYARDAGVAWDESTLTWNNKPFAASVFSNISSDPGIVGSPSPSTPAQVGTRVTFDVTSLATSWLANPATNFGVSITGIENATFVNFRTSDWSTASERPELIITTVPEPSSIGLLALGVCAAVLHHRRNRRASASK